MTDQVADAVCGAVAAQLQLALDEVAPDAVLVDLGAQSLDFVELVFSLEGEFDIQLPQWCTVPDDHTVQNYIDAVAEQLACRDGEAARG